ncbi:MAG: PRC and DUF2382 domain-containing protein, partial [Thermoleophilaceae bacterium]|nr:PRC and DUF2382 domain-containing protein [Thermoleophilaceae bacterium]
MIDKQTLLSLRGQELTDRNGDKIGKVAEVYLDQETDKPEWALVKRGMFGSGSTFVPLAGATEEAGQLRVDFDKDQVKDAPGFDADRELSQDDEAQLYSHYGIDYGEQRSDSGLPEGGMSDSSRGGMGGDVSGSETDDAMTRSEEELRVGSTQREAGRARLRKHVVTEQVQQTVPVQREEVRIEREPITDANVDQAGDGPAISEEEHEVTLMQEEVVTEKRAVPKERVRLSKDTVTEDVEVSEEV